MHNYSYRQNWCVNFLVNDKYRFYRHLLIWVYLLYTELGDPNDQRQYSGNYDLYRYFAKILLFLLAVYVNMYVLVPRLLLKDQYFAYLFALISVTAMVYLVPAGIFTYYFESHHLANSQGLQGIFKEIMPNINVLGVAVFSSTSIKLLQQWKKDATRMNDLEKITLEIELRELKNQINPHFLFNMLNNVNVLIRRDAEKASAVVMKLSEFLRYQLYETSGGSVSLHSEIKFLEDFLELEKIRRDDFSFNISNDNNFDVTGLELPPGLFLTFVENAVKYSADPDALSSVSLWFVLSKKELRFTCNNTIPQEPFSTQSGGLGLVNIVRRLDLLYGSNYTLEIQNMQSFYSVNLSIPI
jgi:two-component system LytT family sensor kinase